MGELVDEHPEEEAKRDHRSKDPGHVAPDDDGCESIPMPKISWSMSVVASIWLPMIYANSGIISKNVQWSRIGIPKSRPIRRDPSIKYGLSF